MAINGNEFVVDELDCSWSMHTDRTKLKQILINLLGNAAKFTKNGQVTLKVEPSLLYEQSVYTFMVTDNGIGMTQDVMLRIFKPFEQSDNSLTRSHDGTGLGLTICKTFSEVLGGSVSVTSTEGAGTTFTVILPTACADAGSGMIMTSLSTHQLN